MSYYSDFINGIKIIKGMVLMGLFLCLLPSCGTIMLPPLEVVSCSVENNTVFIEFSLPPDFSSLKNGLSVTEDGKKLEGNLSVLGNKAQFVPTYGIQENREYIIRIEAGTEDGRGHSLMETFEYTHSTRDNLTTLTVEIVVVQNSFPIQLEFSQAIDKESLENGLRISPDFDYFLEYYNGNHCVRVIPKKQLENNQRYIVSLDSSVMDIHRNFLPKEVAKSFYYQMDLNPLELSFKVSQQEVEHGGTVPLAPDEWIYLEFTKDINLDQVSSFIFLEPVGHSTIASPLEIVRDYKGGRSLRLRPRWNSDENEAWGKSWRLVVQPGIEDTGGNALESEQEITLAYTLEKFRPPEFLGALMTNLDGEQDLRVVFSPSNPFSSMVLPPETYPSVQETFHSTVELNLFFKVSSEATGMDEFSLMEHTLLSAANDCCELTLKRLEGAGIEDTSLYEDFLLLKKELPEFNQELQVDSGNSGKIVTVKFQLELLNKNQRGLVTLELAPETSDSLGNKLGKTSICQVNKL